MKYSFSLGTTGQSSAAALWYWNGINEMLGVCCYDGLEIPFQAWSFNGGRGAAPVCAEAIRTKYGDGGKYNDYLKKVGIKDGLSGLHITAQNIIGTMMEYNIPAPALFGRIMDLAKETIDVLAEAGSKNLIFSPSPMISTLNAVWGTDYASYTEKMAETIIAINEIAKEKGIQVSLRNEFYGIYRGTGIDALMDKLPADVCYSPDTAHLFIAGADAVEMVKKYEGRLACVKFSDTFYQDTTNSYCTARAESPQEGTNQRVYCTLGNGKVDFDGIFKALVAGGYDGWITLETRKAFNVEKTMMIMQVYRKKHFDPILAEVK